MFSSKNAVQILVEGTEVKVPYRKEHQRRHRQEPLSRIELMASITMSSATSQLLMLEQRRRG